MKLHNNKVKENRNPEENKIETEKKRKSRTNKVIKEVFSNITVILVAVF